MKPDKGGAGNKFEFGILCQGYTDSVACENRKQEYLVRSKYRDFTRMFQV